MSAQAPRVPAWKRLGLKLKGPATPEGLAGGTHTDQQSHTAPSTQTNGTRTKLGAGIANKRKVPHVPNPDTDTVNKRLRREVDGVDTPSLKRQTSVSFAEGTKTDAAQGTAGTETKKKGSKRKKKRSKAAGDDASSRTKPTKGVATEPDPAFDLTPALAYLRQWFTNRAAWKFNKNHQTLLIKYVFASDRAVPGPDLPAFLDYIRALKGGVRTRLRDAATAAKVQADTMEGLNSPSAAPVAEKGADGQDAQESKKQDQEAKKQIYDEVIARFLEEVKHSRERVVPPSSSKTAGKRSIDEVEFVLRTMAAADPEVRQHVIKRIRAELVLDALSDGEESTTGTTSRSASGPAAAEDVGEMMDVDDDNADLASASHETVADASAQAPPQPGQLPKPKRVRRKKIRTAVVAVPESSSGSESDSEGESSESSSSSGDSDDDGDDDGDDDELRAPAAADDAETSSSSSSSQSGSEASESDDDETGVDGDEGGEEEA